MINERPTSSTTAPKRRPFRNKFTTVRLAPDAVERQSRITLLAWNALGADAAIAFLNNYSEALDGRPLDLAVASRVGYDLVEQAITIRSARG